MSDNHGDDRICCENVNHMLIIISIVDSEAYHKEMLSGYICVKGNNDWALDLPQEAFI